VNYSLSSLLQVRALSACSTFTQSPILVIRMIYKAEL